MARVKPAIDVYPHNREALPETRPLPPYMDSMPKQIRNAIDGTVIHEDDTFYVVKKDGRKINFSLEAEGLRKLALLWKLIRNGLLGNGAILLWDGPESNLNPELFPLVANLLLMLQQNDVQIFIATHSYNIIFSLPMNSFWISFMKKR